MLLYALTWPAKWLNERALPITSKRYQNLILQRLDAIAQHGQPASYLPCFPRYLLKALQDWFTWHGEDLYDELKHIRNSLPNLIHLIHQLPTRNSPDIVTPLAQAHAILAIRYHRKKPPQPKQLTLF